MNNLLKFAAISILLVGVFSCSAASPEKAAADARVEAAHARVVAADANARVTAADAHVKAADAGIVTANADARVAAAASPSAKAVFMPSRAKIVIPSGTVLKVSLIDALDSDTSSPGDRFLASLAESVVVNGATLLPKGTKVRGRVIDADGSGRVKGRAAIRLALTDINAEIIAGGAGVGAVIGAITGGKTGAGIGAVTGGGAGTGVVLATKGKEIHYGPETRLNFTLTNSVEL
jgi:hypothetical protein